MAFGEHKGPPASHSQLKQLTELLLAAGHTDFRDARGPLGLNQRQAGGKFTRDEAGAFIAQLESEAESGESSGITSAVNPLVQRDSKQIAALKKIPSDVLAAELQERGWAVMEP